jgi:hypothetical protein
LRYFAIINLNVTKKNVYTQINLGNNQTTKLQVYWTRFLKVFTSSPLTTALVIASYFVSVVLFVIVNAIEKKFVCTFDTLLALKYLNTVELIIIYLLILITLISDIIPNFKLIMSCHWIQFIFYNDPYYFRAQFIMFLPLMVYSLAIEIVSLATTKDYAGVVQNFGTTIILNTIQVSILWSMCCFHCQ